MNYFKRQTDKPKQLGNIYYVRRFELRGIMETVSDIFC